MTGFVIKLLEVLGNVEAVGSLRSALMVCMGAGLLITSQGQGQAVESIFFWSGLALLVTGVVKFLLLAFSKSSSSR